GLIAAAVALGIVATALGGDGPSPLATARLWLVAAGAVTVGLALSWRPDLWQGLALAGAASLLAGFGTPAPWDSFRLLFGVLPGVAALGAAVVRASPGWQAGV